MKKITVLLFAFVCSALCWQVNAQCNYTIELSDAFGDGWNGGTIDVLVDGVVVLDDVTISEEQEDYASYSFAVETGSDITTIYSAGDWSDENGYRILDVSGTEVFESNWLAWSGPPVNITTGTITASCPSCTQVTIASSTVVEDCDNFQFSVDVDVTSAGDATHISNGTDTWAISGTGVVTVGPFAVGSSQTLTVVHSDTDCNFSLGNITYACPPSNTTCADATTVSCGETINGTSVGSTGVSEDLGCPTIGVNGVWYTFTGTGGDITVTTTASFDHRMGIASGDCGSLSNIICRDLSTGAEVHTIPSTTLGETYYVYIAHYQSGNTTTGTHSITVTCASTDTLDYYNLQWPAAGTIEAGQEYNVYAQAYQAGLTDVTSGQAPGIEAWIGYSTADTNPSGAGWTWVAATFNAEVGDNDEYQAQIGSARPVGTYYYASRFRYNNGPFTYGGIQADGSYGGQWGNDNNISGVLTVTPPPPPVNDECSGAITIACGNTYTGSTTAATPESPDPGTCTTTAGTAGAVWFTFVGANSNDAGAANGTAGDTVTLSLEGSAFDTKIRVYSGACGDFTCVAGNDDNAAEGGPGGSWSLIGFDTTVGTTYYVLVHGWNTSAGNYNLAVSCVAPPEEAPECATNLVAALGDCGNSNTVLSWDAVDGADGYYVTVGTTPEGNDVLDNEDVSGTSVSVAQEASTAYYWTVTPYNVVGSAADCAKENYTTDDTVCYCDAGATSTSFEKIGNVTLTNATTLVEVINNDSSSTTGYEDFTDVVGNVNLGGTYDFSASFTGTSYPVDQVIVWIDFNQDGDFDDEGEEVLATEIGISPWEGEIAIPSTAPLGQTRMRIRLLDTDLTPNFTPCGNSGFGQVEDYTLNIGPTLSLGNVTDTGFTYFPNPVKNTLSLSAQNAIQNVSVYNMLGQEVLRTAPNTVTSEVNMSGLQAGAYFVKVTINDTTETVRIIKQ